MKNILRVLLPILILAAGVGSFALMTSMREPPQRVDRPYLGPLVEAIAAPIQKVRVVVEGQGSSTIGDVVIDWQENDIFTLPHWSWISHTGSSETATIFQSTDRDVMRRLDLLREERA